MSTALVDFTMQDAYCALIAKGIPKAEAAKKLGLSVRTIDAMLRSDADFKASYEEAFMLMVERVHRVVYERACDGDMRAAELFYRRGAPELATQSVAQARTGQTPTVQVAQLTVNVVKELLMSDQAPSLLERLHELPEIIDAEVIDDGDSS